MLACTTVFAHLRFRLRRKRIHRTVLAQNLPFLTVCFTWDARQTVRLAWQVLIEARTASEAGSIACVGLEKPCLAQNTNRIVGRGIKESARTGTA